jgi:hypothetical protein
MSIVVQFVMVILASAWISVDTRAGLMVLVLFAGFVAVVVCCRSDFLYSRCQCHWHPNWHFCRTWSSWQSGRGHLDKEYDLVSLTGDIHWWIASGICYVHLLAKLLATKWAWFAKP